MTLDTTKGCEGGGGGLGSRLTFSAGSSKQGKASRAPEVSNWVVANVLLMPSAAASH